MTRFAASASFLVCLLITFGNAQETLPVQVEVLGLDTDRLLVEYRLLNTSPRSITGWSMRMTTIYDDGRAADQVIRMDHFLNLDKGLREKGPPGPNQFYVGQEGLVAIKGVPKDEITSVDVELLAIIFADGTAIGDRTYVRPMLDYRLGYGDMMRTWERKLRASMAHHSSAEGIFADWLKKSRNFASSKDRSLDYLSGADDATAQVQSWLASVERGYRQFKLIPKANRKPFLGILELILRKVSESASKAERGTARVR